MQDWRIYRGHGEPHEGIRRLPAPPPWRDMTRGGEADHAADRSVLRAHAYQSDPQTVDAVNAALLLRRPLLVTGRPGTGKSSLAYHVALELGLGRMLTWPVTSRTTLKDGLYTYDAVGRLREAGRVAAARPRPENEPPPIVEERSDIGTYLRLGPLGTALLPSPCPRVLLIDELDKSDMDLPNDLLHVFEEGEFEIPELVRLTKERTVEVHTHDPGSVAAVTEGRVQCTNFPFVVLTSNGEREFPPAFLRRCIRLELPEPDVEKLTRIVEAHLGWDATDRARHLIDTFLRNREEGLLSTDQLLNAIYLSLGGGTTEGREELVRMLLRPLGPGT
ncbi:AAA family ATPase [Streptomyces sp. NA02950]|uniref:AAA family ATPase n=1 Tax=Streptomyces sp. NA02950 TaxID=2742137 RepID=UPI001591F528|nr:MoxR family ATPase [Streptomyces sp. NA02950]QKV95974.1 AAA family ATPase [Streptomyces sp. NA02950]